MHDWITPDFSRLHRKWTERVGDRQVDLQLSPHDLPVAAMAYCRGEEVVVELRYATSGESLRVCGLPCGAEALIGVRTGRLYEISGPSARADGLGACVEDLPAPAPESSPERTRVLRNVARAVIEDALRAAKSPTARHQ